MSADCSVSPLRLCERKHLSIPRGCGGKLKVSRQQIYKLLFNKAVLFHTSLTNKDTSDQENVREKVGGVAAKEPELKN